MKREKSPTAEADAVVRDLQKKVEFLDGLRGLVTRQGGALQGMCEGVVRLLPPAWRYPEVCCAKMAVPGFSFATPNWGDSPWRMAAEIKSDGQTVGGLEVAYLAPRPDADEGPFTREERSLLDFLAALLAKTVERLGAIEQLGHTVRQLELERAALQQANAALRGILDRIEEERSEIRRSIAANVDKAVMPILRELEASVGPQERPVVDLLRRSVEEIASPFVDRLSRTFASLTPLEINICRMICQSLSTKEIARIRHVSPSTVARQREHIRRKLGIARSDANLATYLRTFMDGSA